MIRVYAVGSATLKGQTINADNAKPVSAPVYAAPALAFAA